MSIDEAVLFMISSASDKDHSMTDHFGTLKGKNGEPVFWCQNFSLVCPACREAGITSGCTHMETRKPFWQSKRKIDEIEAVTCRVKADFERETLGIMTNNRLNLFPPECVDHILAKPNRFPSSDLAIRFSFICVDPCGGWKNLDKPNQSDFAILSAYYTYNDTLVLTGGDLIPSTSKRDYDYRLLKHFEQLKKIDGLQNSNVVMIYENNADMQAEWFKDYLKEHGAFIHTWMDDRDLQQGVSTDAPLKRAMADLLQGMITNERGQYGFALRVHENFFTTGTSKDSHLDADGVLAMLRQQLCDMSMVMKRAGQR